MASSDIPGVRMAAAQIAALLSAMKSNQDICSRLSAQWEEVDYVKSTPLGMIKSRVNIRIIKELKECATDTRWHADAIRRIREINELPATQFRVFFAHRRSRNAYIVLGIIHRDYAYSQEYLAKLKERYAK